MSLDIDTVADEVAWWTRQVGRDRRISPALAAAIAAHFAQGLALVRVAVMPEAGRVDPGADERARRALIAGLGGLIR